MDLSSMRGVGPARLESLRAVGIVSLRDLLYCLPARYEDRTQVIPCGELRPGDALVMGTVQDKPRLNRFQGLTRVMATLHDSSGKVPLIWYNQPWVMQNLPVGSAVMLYGRITLIRNRLTMINAQIVNEPSIQPVYRAMKGIPPKAFRTMMVQALAQVEDCCPETLPNALRMRHSLCELNFALREAHFPSNFENLKIARRRLAFEQMLMYQAALGMMRGIHDDGIPMPLETCGCEAFWQQMPYAPTTAQKRVLEEIRSDMTRPNAMSRLVQGDVGCGKTAIAFGAISIACKAGFQAAMMAPTEILARQHYDSARKLLDPMGIRCGLLIGSMRAKEKREAHENCANGIWDAVFGTHALISQGVAFQRLGLVVTDEQHRFGVRQRSSLQQKGSKEACVPHVLVMSATPIPRTLALILYGDLDISVVDELPPGRTPVKTRIVPESKRMDMYGFLRREIEAGRQGYVVCPLVEDSEALDDVRSAQATYGDLTSGVLSGLRVGLTWGAQPAEEKAAVLRSFASGELDVLVSTTVIEVGVNVPNASVMIIENAERYGLSQLHQLRGRVGRGSAESWCFLLANENERLKILSQTNDGFEVARKDLELRGPGDLMGTRQSGEMLNGFLLDGDVRLLEEASRCMKMLRENPAFIEERKQIETVAAQQYAEKLSQIALN